MSCVAVTPTAPTTARLMSRFGMRQGVSSGVRRLHAGIDIGGDRGQTIYSVKAGRVALIGQDSVRRGPLDGYGNAVVVEHAGEGKWALYAHLAQVYVAPGQAVAAGTPLGTMGRTTNGKFPRMVQHLHLEVRHAAPGGASPFPGRYGAFNEDPAAWLGEAGIGFTREGLTADPGRGACGAGAGGIAAGAEALRSAFGLEGLGAQVSRIELGPRALGAIGDAAVYEPPIPDPDWYRPAPAWARWGALALGAAIGFAGIALTLDALDADR